LGRLQKEHTNVLRLEDVGMGQAREVKGIIMEFEETTLQDEIERRHAI
jgi:hypothetical protein